MLRGHRSALPPREALILQAADQSPWLLDDHAEELAELEFRHADADRLRARACSMRGPRSSSALTMRRQLRAATRRARTMPDWPHCSELTADHDHRSVWGARPEAAAEDVLVDLAAACHLASAVRIR